jgi:hypothetical protein
VKHNEPPDIIADGQFRLAVVMMMRMKMTLGHGDNEDHGSNRGQETEQN